MVNFRGSNGDKRPIGIHTADSNLTVSGKLSLLAIYRKYVLFIYSITHVYLRPVGRSNGSDKCDNIKKF